MSIKKFPLEAYGAAVSREELVQAALDEITKNYREASLSNVARSYGVSLAYVSECVRAQTGRTYKELLQKHRMETAARLLRRSDWNIQQIITYVGYENTSYFYSAVVPGGFPLMLLRRKTKGDGFPSANKNILFWIMVDP